MTEQKRSEKKSSPAGMYIIGGIGIALLVFWLVPTLIDDAQKTQTPWWKKGEIDRLEVRTCEDTACTKYQSNVYEVLYNGRVSKRYDEDNSSELIWRANRGLSWVNDSALNAWRHEMGISGTRKASEMDAIDGFQILKQADHKNPIETYGYCYQNHGNKSCIAFSGSIQYRFRP